MEVSPEVAAAVAALFGLVVWVVKFLLGLLKKIVTDLLTKHTEAIKENTEVTRSMARSLDAVVSEVREARGDIADLTPLPQETPRDEDTTDRIGPLGDNGERVPAGRYRQHKKARG